MNQLVFAEVHRGYIKRVCRVLILETLPWVLGAAQSMKTGIIVIGASKKSGRGCKPSDEINRCECSVNVL